MGRFQGCRGVVTCFAIAALLVAAPAVAGPARGAVAELHASGASLDWSPLVSHQSMKLTISGPAGLIIEREFTAAPTLSIFDKAGQRLPDGVYNWELRTAPQMGANLKRQLADARRGDEGATDAVAVPQGGVQSGTFRIAAGAFVVDEGETEARSGVNRATDKARITAADQVIPDDLIVQGSECVGLDCVNNENFGFDTIRLKENNLRIHFDDTSTTAGFPANDWRLIANDSASGGSSKFSIEDSTSAKTPFTITAGAATNSIFVDSTGRMGLRTSTPVLDLHINTSNTPAIRLEQNNSGGFTAQTWDIGANEANFFVRDVTGGSKLSLRIRPGAPTSSVDISADGDVGIGTGSPEDRLDVRCSASGKACLKIENSDAAGFSGLEGFDETGTSRFFLGVDNADNTTRINSVGQPLRIMTNSTERIRFPVPGSDFIDVAGNTAALNSIGQWVDASSRELKQDIASLSSAQAMDTLKGLNPVTFAYKAAPDEVQAGFIAEDVPDLVAEKTHKRLSALELVAVLTKVVQDQQSTIDQLATRLAEMERQRSKN